MKLWPLAVGRGRALTVGKNVVLPVAAAGAVAATTDDLSVPSRNFKPMKSMHLANVFTITAQQASYSKSMGTKLCKLAACVSLFLLQLITVSSVHLGVTFPNCGQTSHCVTHAGSYCCPR